MFPWAPYTTNKKGHGPAWAHSLFEDAAEYGFGIRNAAQYRREAIRSVVKTECLGTKAEQLKANGHSLLVDLLQKWEGSQQDRLKSASVAEKVRDYLESLPAERRQKDGLVQLYQERNMLAKKSYWIVGGDGWAYDIGFAGLDHVLASGEKVNVLVLDNEVYANTGGQASKGNSTHSLTHSLTLTLTLTHSHSLSLSLTPLLIQQHPDRVKPNSAAQVRIHPRRIWVL